jgi:hypothetical protein
MRSSVLLTVALISCAPAFAAEPSPPVEIFGGYTRLSNAFNGIPESQNGLNGWDAGVALPAWHGLRVKIDVSGYSGTNLGAKQQVLSIMGGGQYERTFHRERLFVEALFGDVGMNRNWGPNALAGETASFTTLFGGGLDTPLKKHFAFRIQGDYRYENLALVEPVSLFPYRVPGLPHNLGSISTGLVWTPRLGQPSFTQAIAHERTPVASELQFEDLNSFGHFHIFANSWWSYLHVAGVEYDRHSWGKFIGARMDYVAEILPVAILKQPSQTYVWGNPNPAVSTFTTLYGVGISPVGLRMMWRDGRAWKPFYTIKGGLIAFNGKALSQYAAYLNFSLQQSIGVQFRLNHRWDLRASIGHFHFSDAFIVPSNPGIDEMFYSGSLSFHLGKQPAGE